MPSRHKIRTCGAPREGIFQDHQSFRESFSPQGYGRETFLHTELATKGLHCMAVQRLPWRRRRHRGLIAWPARGPFSAPGAHRPRIEYAKPIGKRGHDLVKTGVVYFVFQLKKRMWKRKQGSPGNFAKNFLKDLEIRCKKAAAHHLLVGRVPQQPLLDIADADYTADHQERTHLLPLAGLPAFVDDL